MAEEIKTTRSVEMTDDELAAYQAFKQEQARKEAAARIERLRANYRKMAETFSRLFKSSHR